MKYLKNYKIFESNYNFEEFVDVIIGEFSKYNVTPVQVNDLIEKYEDSIKDSISNGIDPLSFINPIIKGMNLDNGGGFMSHRISNQVSSSKYL